MSYAPGDPYQPLERIKARVDYEPTDFFENNATKRFDRLIMGTAEVGDTADTAGWRGLEYEARKMIENAHSDEPFSEETGRVDEKRAPASVTLPLVFPVNEVSKVEKKRTLRADWEEVEAFRYQVDDSGLTLERTPIQRGRAHGGTRRNTLADRARRLQWNDIASKIRVTYDRGFNPVPGDVQSVQISLINRMLRTLKQEQTMAAASPEEFQGVTPEFDSVMTDNLLARIESITPLYQNTRAI